MPVWLMEELILSDSAIVPCLLAGDFVSAQTSQGMAFGCSARAYLKQPVLTKSCNALIIRHPIGLFTTPCIPRAF